MYSLYKNEYGILKLTETTISNGLRENEEKQRRGAILGYITSIPRNIARKFPVSFFFFSSSKLENRRAEQVLHVEVEAMMVSVGGEGGGGREKG
jgi:hypothetical protein